MEETKLQLEAGKYYRTRDGRKAFVAAICLPDLENPEMDRVMPVYGSIEDEFESWTIDGSFNGVAVHKGDLVAEWVEPKRIKGFVNIFMCRNLPDNYHTNGVWESREKADSHDRTYDGDARVACIALDVLEGHGLEGGQ